MKSKTVFLVIGTLALGYWLMKGQGEITGLRGYETSIPDSSQPNMKTKVPAGANNDHIWLVKG